MPSTAGHHTRAPAWSFTSLSRRPEAAGATLAMVTCLRERLRSVAGSMVKTPQVWSAAGTGRGGGGRRRDRRAVRAALISALSPAQSQNHRADRSTDTRLGDSRALCRTSRTCGALATSSSPATRTWQLSDPAQRTATWVVSNMGSGFSVMADAPVVHGNSARSAASIARGAATVWA